MINSPVSVLENNAPLYDTANLDPTTRLEMYELLARLASAQPVLHALFDGHIDAQGAAQDLLTYLGKSLMK